MHLLLLVVVTVKIHSKSFLITKYTLIHLKYINYTDYQKHNPH